MDLGGGVCRVRGGVVPGCCAEPGLAGRVKTPARRAGPCISSGIRSGQATRATQPARRRPTACTEVASSSSRRWRRIPRRAGLMIINAGRRTRYLTRSPVSRRLGAARPSGGGPRKALLSRPSGAAVRLQLGRRWLAWQASVAGKAGADGLHLFRASSDRLRLCGLLVTAAVTCLTLVMPAG